MQAHAAVAQQRKHRRRVGRADDRRHQQPQLPRNIEQESGKHPQQADAGQHPPAGQHRCRFERDAEHRKRRAQAAVEQNQRQRQLAHQRRADEIVKGDFAHAFFARQHADAEKHQQQRHPQPRRQPAGHHADKQQQCHHQKQDIEFFFHRGFLRTGAAVGFD